MAETNSTCPHCQAQVSSDTRFCGSCGRPIASEAPPKKAPMARTMMGLDAQAVSAATERAKATAHLADTQPEGVAAPSAAPAQAQPAPAPAPSPAPAAARLPAKTMIGLAGAGLPASAPLTTSASTQPMPAQPSAAAPGGKSLPARTMLGMAGVGLPTAPTQPFPAHAAPTPAAAPARGVAGGRTMLGVPLASASTSEPAAAPTPSHAHTMLGAFESGSGQHSAYGEDPSYADEPSTERNLPKPAGRSPLWLGIAAALVLGLALLLFLRARGHHTDVSAKIVSIDIGEALLFEVPSAPAGSKIRFGGQEKPLAAGRATFALAADSLRVGDNVVLADVVYPGGEVESTRITLAVSYRLWVDTAPLRADKSAVDVVMTALPGTHITLDGQEVKLDAEGRATREFPIDITAEAKAGVIDHVVHYRVQPPVGETVVDELHTQIPIAMMQLDRPGRDVVTDRESIEVAGAVGKDTVVAIDGTSIGVKDGRFLYRYPLPKAGTYKPRVVASAVGKVPMGIALQIRRVGSLEEAAEEFAPDRELTYAKLAPNPSIYRGQKISLEGRVYHTDPHGAESVIQMFARPCPSTQRCSVWVVDPAATEVAVDSWIRVLGTVDGEQQFRSEKNDVVTVPKLQARFVLPAKP